MAKVKRVCVLGAGMAGLITALELRDLGCEVILLEAQHRPGGRVQTYRAPFSDGLYAEAGATYIPGGHDLTQAYLRRFGVKLHPIPEEKLFTFWQIAGRRVRVGVPPEAWNVELSQQERSLGLDGLLERYVGPALSAFGRLDDPDWLSPELRALDELSFHEYLRRQGASDGAILLIRRSFPDIHGDGVEETSALFCIRDFLNEGGGWSLIEGGSDTFPRAIAANLSEVIRYAAAAEHIEHGDASVAVRYRQAGQTRWVEADHLVVAMQTSCLQQIDLAPALDPDTVDGISRMAHTAVTRVFLQTRTRYWGDDGPEYMGMTDLPAIGIRDASYHLPGRRGLLECYVPGSAAKRLAQRPLAEQRDAALEWVEQVLPGVTDELELAASKAWGDDPFARGGYVYLRPGEFTSLMPKVGRPSGRIHFAGDHTSPWPAWIQGAIHSAHRVVREITGVTPQLGA